MGINGHNENPLQFKIFYLLTENWHFILLKTKDMKEHPVIRNE